MIFSQDGCQLQRSDCVLPCRLQVPSLRLALERFVFETHVALLEACWPAGSVFRLGSLQHQNLQKEEVPAEVCCSPHACFVLMCLAVS